MWTTRHSVLLLLMVLLMVPSACRRSETPAAPEPKGGNGEFRVLLPAEPTTLNPDLRFDDAAFSVAQNLYNKLVTLDADYRVIPDLAVRWDISPDGLTYTFHLAAGVKWHDGRPFTSVDVKWTLETLAREQGSARRLARRIARIDAPDATTLVVRLREPYAPFIAALAWYGTFVLPRHIYEGADWTANAANDRPVGTGPFRFVEWIRGDHITAAANLDYFRRGPFLDRVVWRFQKPGVLTADAVATGEVDYSQALPPREQVAELRRMPGVHVRTYPSANRYFIGMNVRRKPLDDVRVRRAINMAVDRSSVVSRAFAGLGTPGVGFYTPAIPWAYNPDAQAPAYDPKAAMTLLDEAGVRRGPGGVRATLSLVAWDTTPFRDVATIVQEHLRVVGIDVAITLLAPSNLEERVYRKHDFDFFLTDGSHGPDPENLRLRFGSPEASVPLGYASAEFDAAVEEGARNTDIEVRARAYFRAQQILARDLPIAPLVDPAFIVLSRDTVSGLAYNEARGLVTFQDYSLVRVKR